jgi:hypothetical protein
MQSIIPVLAICLIFASCQSLINSTLISTQPEKNIISGAQSLQVLDTMILIKDIKASNYSGPDLSDSIAREVLYEYFLNKRIYNDVFLADTTIDDDILTVFYRKIYFADLNANKYKDAVISYWITPYGASGHCYQPDKAIIIDTDAGYKITNEEFIPMNYFIDSLVEINNQVILLGYDYNCGMREI